MDPNSNTEHGAGNAEAYPESEDWEFPLSASLADIENITSGQHAIGFGHAMPFEAPRTQGAAGDGEGIAVPPKPDKPQRKKSAKGKGKATVRGHASVKRVSQRGKAFNKEEDRVICSAFLNVSKDPIIGNNQSSGSYYQRLHEYFVENMDGGTTRSQVAISNRWLSIQRAVNTFCGCLSTVERIDSSGKTERDRLADAVKMFEDREPWALMHCWEILKDEPKWNDKMLELNSGANSTRVNQELPGNPGGQSISEHADNDPLDRPEGRDTAKKRRNRAAGDNTASSTAVEVLQSMHERSQKKDDKEDTQMAQILQRKDAKIELQQRNGKKMEIEKEKLQLTREEVQMRKDQTKVEMLKAKAHFMGQDLEKLAPHLREYYISIQREIMERHGIRPPPNNSSNSTSRPWSTLSSTNCNKEKDGSKYKDEQPFGNNGGKLGEHKPQIRKLPTPYYCTKV
ncbi:hypothetical protein U9M48_037706 [Paspalum notatum var. saurae]|uniref:No apical meristem-associated C-terminal domain-containing protein n=1 Tax=Paspalum notatum var. saurae TaxID=547442 RepID=A0AAQ3UHP3_PASNO